jgi:hypothetical protein
VTRTLSPRALRGADEVSVVICAIAGDDNAYVELVRRRQGALRQLFRRRLARQIAGVTIVLTAGAFLAPM